MTEPDPNQDKEDLGAVVAAQLIPAFANILDFSAEATGLEQVLPEGCTYRRIGPGQYPEAAQGDLILLFGVLGRHEAPLEILRRVRLLERPLICDHEIGAAQDISAFDVTALQRLMQQAGFRQHSRQRINATRTVFKWEPDGDGPALPRSRPKKILVLSYYNVRNFGDRLGYHVINSLLPADALITHAPLNPMTIPEGQFDLAILGFGSSLNAPSLRHPDLHRLIDATPHSIGIFGTQYRHQYRELMDPRLFDALLDKLTTWWARYEDDVLAFGRGRTNVRHLGDWLISAFPNAVPTLDKTLAIPADVMDKDLPLDRVIQEIQAYRRVSTARIHPMLCALTSAEEVAYQEQRELAGNSAESGKFRSQLYDIFGRTFDEGRFFKVDHQAVIRYKMMVAANIAALKAQISGLLSSV